MLASLVAFDITLEAPRIAVGSGPHQFTLSFAASGSGSVYLSASSSIDGMVSHRGAQSGQPIRFDPQYSIRTFIGLNPGDYAVIRNTSGYFMQLKIVSVTSKDQGGSGARWFWNTRSTRASGRGSALCRARQPLRSGQGWRCQARGVWHLPTTTLHFPRKRPPRKPGFFCCSAASTSGGGAVGAGCLAVGGGRGAGIAADPASAAVGLGCAEG